MSNDLYETRVIFDHRSWYAKSDGIEYRFPAQPEVPGLPEHVTEVDFAPEVRCHELRVLADRRREMYAPEIEALMAWLKALTKALSQAAKFRRKR